MEQDWRFVGKTFCLGLALTGVGILLVIYLGWDEASLAWLAFGSLLLLCAIALALAYFLFARYGTPHVPEGWHSLSFEERQDLARKQLLERNSWSSKLALWVMKKSDAQWQQVRERGFLSHKD